VLLFAVSDKGGTGRSVTSCNIAYRQALQGIDVCYLDFDFGSPTAGAIFEVGEVSTGTAKGGLHSYLQQEHAEPRRVDVWTETDRPALRGRPLGAGRLVLFPGDQGGGEFPSSAAAVERCADLMLRLEEEFAVVIVDLSAGRSHAVDMSLAVTAMPALGGVVSRWMVFHRWTRQHILAASGLVFGPRGILDAGKRAGHDEFALRTSIRFVRTAVFDLELAGADTLKPPQAAWLEDCNRDLTRLATQYRLGRTSQLGQTPLDPVLQWREQIITDTDVATTKIANKATADAFTGLATAITDKAVWEVL
jgi:hypothetical protein